MQHFGIIGNPLKQSFSAKYFTEKFMREHIDADYRLFPLESIDLFPRLCAEHQFTGLNVTLPFKETVIPYLDDLDDTARKIGAVNVIKFEHGNRLKGEEVNRLTGRPRLIGYNTDTIGFSESLSSLLCQCSGLSAQRSVSALVLGTGGAAKAVIYALRQMGINVHVVSRSEGYDYTYHTLTADIIREHLLVVNCTPLGMFPDTDACADIPYEGITPQHLCYDVIYNPAETLFLSRCKAHGATVCNGLGMLYGQAQAAWRIWQC